MKKSLVVVSLTSFCLWLITSHSRVVTAETIECKFEMSVWTRATESLLYRCDVTNKNQIFNMGERVHTDGVRGEHEARKGNEQVQGLRIGGAPNMGAFPTGLAEIFPHLLGIVVSNCNLRHLTSEDLSDFSELKYLWLYKNQLTHIRGDLFERNENLEVLGLYGNRIEHVDSNSLSGLRKLEYLNFNENPCTLDKAETRAEVEAIVRRIEAGECQSDAYTTQNPLEVKIQQLEADLETMTAKVSKQATQIETLEAEKQAMEAKLKDQAKKIEDDSKKFDKILQTIVSTQQAGKKEILAAIGGGCGRLSVSYETLNERFSNFTAVFEQLEETEEQLHLLEFRLNVCDNQNRKLTHECVLQQQLLMLTKKGGNV